MWGLAWGTRARGDRTKLRRGVMVGNCLVRGESTESSFVLYFKTEVGERGGWISKQGRTWKGSHAWTGSS